MTMMTERRLGRLEEQMDKLPEAEQAAQDEATARYLNDMDPADRRFLASARMDCLLHGGWHRLSPDERAWLARLVGPIDPEGLALRRLQNPPILTSRIPAGAPASEAAEICLNHIREGKAR